MSIFSRIFRSRSVLPKAEHPLVLAAATKVCRRCKCSLPPSSFRRHNLSLDGRRHLCRGCDSAPGRKVRRRGARIKEANLRKSEIGITIAGVPNEQYRQLVELAQARHMRLGELYLEMVRFYLLSCSTSAKSAGFIIPREN